MMCEAMKWNHLPNAGGIYDQDPVLMKAFMDIFSERSKHQAKEAKKRERESNQRKSKSGNGRASRPTSRRRR